MNLTNTHYGSNTRHTTKLIALILVTAAISVSVTPRVGFAQGAHTYTLDADFDLGVLFNINHTNLHDQLQINPGTLTTFPIMWIANAGEDSVSKIDTTTGRELARYRTWFGPAGQPGYLNHVGNEYAGAAPSRTAVDRDGNCYVANRHFDGRSPDVIKILATGGIDRNTNGVIDTSIDLNNSGVIDAGEILNMADSNGNGRIDPNEIQDERVAWAVTLGAAGSLGRSLAIDNDGNIWLGLYNTSQYYKLSGVDGSIIAGPISVSPNTPYGALVDGNGILWGASLDGTLLKMDTHAPYTHSVFNHGFGNDYGIAIGNGHVYQANYGGNTYTEFDPVAGTFSSPATIRFSTLGIAVDGNGDIFVGNYDSGGVAKFRANGTAIWAATPQPGTLEVRGCIVDANNDVWLIHRNSKNISKYRGTDGLPLGVFPTGYGPYTYTDATGIGRFNSTEPSGSWTVVDDSGITGTLWGTITWHALLPTNTSIKVEARAAETPAGLDTKNYREVTNGVSFCDSGLVGSLIQVRATLSRPLNETNSPVLLDLTIEPCNGPRLDKVNLATGTNVSIGDVFTYCLTFDTYSNAASALGLRLIDYVPIELDVLDFTTNCSQSAYYDQTHDHVIVWDFGTWPPLSAGCTNCVTVRVNTNALLATNIINVASLISSNLPPSTARDHQEGCETNCVGIAVAQNKPPVARCREGTIVASADATNCTASVSIDGGSFDPDTNDTIVVTQVPPGPYSLGTNNVILIVTDSHGATSSCAGLVVVVDTTPPTVTCPGDIVATNAPGQCSAVVSFLTSAFDACGGLSGSNSVPSGSAFPVGVTTVTFRAFDGAGNSKSCSFTVTVLDREAPEVACRQAPNPSSKKIPVSGKNTSSGQNPDGYYQLLAKDNCDPDPLIYVHDTNSSFVSGPYHSGDVVKLSQNPGGTPYTDSAPPPVVAHIHLKGDALVYSVDSNGNQSPNPCLALIPPAPK